MTLDPQLLQDPKNYRWLLVNLEYVNLDSGGCGGFT